MNRRSLLAVSPGGAHDIIARLWTERMRQFGAFVVENRSGAGTIIGTVEVARGTPDGYLLLLGSTNTHVLQPLTASTRSYDPLADFSPISILGTTATAIAVTPGLPERVAGIEFSPKARMPSQSVSCGTRWKISFSSWARWRL